MHIRVTVWMSRAPGPAVLCSGCQEEEMLREPVQPGGGALATALEAMCEAESPPWRLDRVEAGPIASDQSRPWGLDGVEEGPIASDQSRPWRLDGVEEGPSASDQKALCP